MSHYFRLCARLSSYAILVFFLVQLTTSPVAAQINTNFMLQESGIANSIPSILPPTINDSAESSIPQGPNKEDTLLQANTFNPEPQVEESLEIDETTIATGKTIQITATLTNSGEVTLPAYSLKIGLSDDLQFSQTGDEEKTTPELAVNETYQWDFAIDISAEASGLQIISLYGGGQNSPTIDTHVTFDLGIVGALSPTILAVQSPDAPEAWAPKFVEPELSLFSGAASYTYPFDVVPGRNGLQPSLALRVRSLTTLDIW
ncbi:MAG: hypothetical protein IPJ90_00740 [Anaerolineaceae bacterium]|nr:hypothetical protein [Anaerolineaceae bacterium]